MSLNTELSQKLTAMAEADQHMLQQLLKSGELPSEEYHPRCGRYMRVRLRFKKSYM
jgi:hypothetical protein